MTRPVVGVVAGAIWGLIDGLSAWFSPEARAMMVPIILGSTVKGLLTGLSVGLVAKWKQSLPLGILAGALVGFVLSSLVAMGQPAHYWEIVLPGMLVGVITGVICQRWRVAVVAICCLLGVSGLAGASHAPAASRLSTVQPLVGKWQGTSEGQPGTGTLTREYRAVLRDRFIEETNRSIYPPQEKNAKGEIHEHRSFFSFDNARKTVVFRQFHGEGFVNRGKHFNLIAAAPFYAFRSLFQGPAEARALIAGFSASISVDCRLEGVYEAAYYPHARADAHPICRCALSDDSERREHDQSILDADPGRAGKGHSEHPRRKRQRDRVPHAGRRLHQLD